MEAKATSDRNIVTVKLREVICNGTGGRSHSHAVFSYKGQIHLVNLNGEDCGKYNVGDSVPLLYSVDNGIFFPKDINTSPELMQLSVVAIGIALIIIYLLFPRLSKFFHKDKHDFSK